MKGDKRRREERNKDRRSGEEMEVRIDERRMWSEEQWICLIAVNAGQLGQRL